MIRVQIPLIFENNFSIFFLSKFFTENLEIISSIILNDVLKLPIKYKVYLLLKYDFFKFIKINFDVCKIVCANF